MQYHNIGVYYDKKCSKKQSLIIGDIISTIQKKCNVIDLTATPNANPDLIIILGGDGVALECMNAFLDNKVPFYGVNLGTFGFFMNTPPTNYEQLFSSISEAQKCSINPLECEMTLGAELEKKKVFSINEVTIFRKIQQTVNLSVSINGVVRLRQMKGDGLVICSPIGSSGYNFSLGGPILPINSNLIAITPAASFSPRNWKGAILDNNSFVDIIAQDNKKRPAYIAIDGRIFDEVVEARISVNKKKAVTIMFDKEIPIGEKMIREQFLFQ